MAAGAALRIDGVGGIFLYGDELHSLALSRQGYGAILRSYDPLGSGIALPLLQRLCLDLFGEGLWAFRLPSLAGGVVGLALVYPLTRDLVGRPAAALATLALALDPLHLYYSHFARSYTLAVAAGLVLVYALRRAPDDRRLAAAAAATAGLRPWLHPTAAGFALGAFAAAALSLLVGGRARGAWRRLAATGAAGAGLALALHLPAWQAASELLAAKLGRGEPEFGALDVAARMAGSAPAGALWLAALPPAGLWMLWARREPALWVASAVAAPVLALVAARPVGGELAFARYLLPALPFALALLAWALAEAASRALPGHAQALALGCGSLLVAAAWWVGPLGPGQAPNGPFANLAYSLVPRPAGADAPRPATPAFYADLARDPAERLVVETPLVASHELKLYRNYWLQHRKRVHLGFFGRSGIALPRGPYVDLSDPREARAAGADYVILHRDVEVELGRRSAPLPGWRRAARRLERSFGAPVYEDAAILVYAP